MTDILFVLGGLLLGGGLTRWLWPRTRTVEVPRDPEPEQPPLVVPPTARFKVVEFYGQDDHLLYVGNSGAHARQAFEQAAERGEVTLWDESTCRGRKGER